MAIVKTIGLTEVIGDLSISDTTEVELAASTLLINGVKSVSTTALACDLALSGIGGLDTGSIAANTVYYIYAIDDSGSVALIASTSSSNPSGYTTSNSRIVGAAQVNNSSEILMVTQTNDFNSDSVSFTPTIDGMTSLTLVNANYHRRNEKLRVVGFVNVGSTSATDAAIHLPGDVAAKSANLAGAFREKRGHCARLSGGITSYQGGNYWDLVADVNNLTKIYFSNSNAAVTAFTKAQASSLLSNGDSIAFEFELSIEGWSAKSGLDGRVK